MALEAPRGLETSILTLLPEGQMSRSGNKGQLIGCWCDEKFVRRIDRGAAKSGVDRSEFLRRAMQEKCDTLRPRSTSNGR
jgi:hypothetical protein